MEIKLRNRKKKTPEKERANSPFNDGSQNKKSAGRSIPGFDVPIGIPKVSIRIPGLRTFKRLVTVGLLFLSGCLGFGMISNFKPSTMNLALLWFFILSTWIFSDYLWKTRHHKDKEAFKRDVS